jgi:hypothetical protein
VVAGTLLECLNGLKTYVLLVMQRICQMTNWSLPGPDKNMLAADRNGLHITRDCLRDGRLSFSHSCDRMCISVLSVFLF